MSEETETDITSPGAPEFDPDFDLDLSKKAPQWERMSDGRFKVGDLIMNRYKVLAELGQGGMGVVYKCFDETAGVEIALKALPPELSHNTLEMEDIKDNFQLVHNLHHPNIASSNNLERNPENGNYYLIMECCNGEDLRRWLKRKRRDDSLTLSDVLFIVKQVAEALDYAHKQKVMHRDIKPANIMIDNEGTIKVLDFGLAAQIHTSMTRVSMAYRGTSGTGPYMAPEQWRGKKQGAASDQYALAVMTYEMLSGDLPFESTAPAVLQQAVLTQQAALIEGFAPEIQNALDRAMSKDPAKRFSSCRDFYIAMIGEEARKAEEARKEAARRKAQHEAAADQKLELSWDATTVTGVTDTSITSVEIPEGITSIGDRAFRGCSNLTSIKIPDSVTSIGDSAFYKCKSLTSITIPDSVTSIGDGAFLDCISLTRITISDSVTSIGKNAFKNCDKLTSIKIPDSVTSIGDSAFFGCESLTSVTIPDSVTSIGDGAFWDCIFLTRITISDSVTSIGDSAFYGCENLTSIKIPDSVTGIGKDAFNGIKDVQYTPAFSFEPNGVLINKKHKSLVRAPENLLGNYTIPDSVTSIGDEAFEDCENLTSITIPDSVTSIGDGAFQFSENLTSITIGNGVTSIGNEAFYGCDSLTSITIPDSVTSIGYGAFYKCKSLTSITIPDSVTSIGYSAFYGCEKLTSITIPDSVTSIGYGAFAGCSLTSITIPDSVTSIGDSAFSHVEQVQISPENQNFLIDPQGLLIDKKQQRLLYAPPNVTSITIPDSVTSIGNEAFYGCDSLTSITIPDSVTSIGYGAFYKCKSLTSITIPDSVTSIGFGAFWGCSNLTSITIPDSVTSIGERAFTGCKSLTSVTIPDSVTSIGDSAFFFCKSLTSLTIPSHFTDEDVKKWSLPENCKIIRK